MENLEESLKATCEEIKEDFNLPKEAGTPYIQTLDEKILKEIYKDKELLSLITDEIRVEGHSLISHPYFKGNSILTIFSPFIIEGRETVEKSLTILFADKMVEINNNDKPRVFGITSLAPIYLKMKLDTEFPEIHPYISSLSDLLKILYFIFAEDLQSKSVEGIYLAHCLNNLSVVSSFYEKLCDWFYGFYFSKKLKEMKYSHLILGEHLQNEKIDFKNLHKYFEFVRAVEPQFKPIGLNPRGRYDRTIFTKSIDEFLSYSASAENLLYMFGGENLLQKIFSKKPQKKDLI